MRTQIGHIISGSLSEGFTVKIDSSVDTEAIKTGKFVSIKGQEYTFFSIVTDLQLETTHQNFLQLNATNKDSLLYQALKQKHMYVTANLRPMLMLNKTNNISPVKTIPQHFSPVCQATKQDVAAIFGDDKKEPEKYFHIGNPLDMETPVCLNLDKFTERSNGIFGKTGTGKTFLTRLVLAGLIKNNKAVSIIFDMHSEYGLQARKEGSKSFVKGLKTLFPTKVVIFSLDPEATRRRGASPDVNIVIPYTAIKVEDIMALQNELNLHATAVEAAYLIAGKYKDHWLEVLLAKGADAKELAQETGAHPESVAALYRKLRRIDKLPFIQHSNSHTRSLSMVDQMLEYIDKDINIIIEFGNFTSTFCYLLIANIITRRLHKAYIEKTESFLGSHKKEKEPKKLMIVIEEAHKFLNPQAAQQTIFGTIAREMRKYYVSLLIIDQRPSGVDPEILSQVGTKIVAQLNDEKDIQAVLTGAANSSALRVVMGGLDSKKQALLVGHATSMPIVVETREYNEDFYAAVQLIPEISASQAINELF